MNHEEIDKWWEDYHPKHYEKRKKTKWGSDPFRKKEKVNKPKRGTRQKSIAGCDSNG